MKNVVRLIAPTVDSQDIEEILHGNMFADAATTKGNRTAGVVSYFDIYLDRVESFFIDSSLLCFGYRIDEPKISASVEKSHFDKLCKIWLETSTFEKVPKEIRNQLREQALSELRGKIPPTPEIYRCFWDLKKGEILYDGRPGKTLDIFKSIFRNLFEEDIKIKPFFYQLKLSADIKAELENNYSLTEKTSAEDGRLEHLWSDMLGWMVSKSFVDVSTLGVCGNIWFTSGDEKLTVNANSHLKDVVDLAFEKGMTVRAAVLGFCEEGGLGTIVKLDSTMTCLQSLKLPEMVSDEGEAVADLILIIAEIEKLEEIICGLAVEYIEQKQGDICRVVFEGKIFDVTVREGDNISDLLTDFITSNNYTLLRVDEIELRHGGWVVSPDAPITEIMGKNLEICLKMKVLDG